MGLSPLTGKSGLSHTNGDRRFCVHVTHILSCAGQYGCTKCNLCRCANVLYKSNCSQKLAATRSVLNNVQRMQVDVQGWLYNVLCWRSRGHNLGHIFHTPLERPTRLSTNQTPHNLCKLNKLADRSVYLAVGLTCPHQLQTLRGPRRRSSSQSHQRQQGTTMIYNCFLQPPPWVGQAAQRTPTISCTRSCGAPAPALNVWSRARRRRMVGRLPVSPSDGGQV